MSENTVKFYKYKNTSGRIILPKKITDVLNWAHLDEIRYSLEPNDDQIKLCLYKKGENKNKNKNQ
jgi:bifunctional DNA-binding transcriptional regulator/antitoxin component of YhaV-PrlF toxin-antitoxin module